MKKYLLPANGNFYKTNLHCHTTVSDGDFTPEEIKTLYKTHGYHAVAFTDHEVLIAHPELCDDGFIALNGYEIAIKPDGPQSHAGAFGRVFHLCLVAKTPDNLLMTAYTPEYVTVGNGKDYLSRVQYTGYCEREYSRDGVERIIRDAHAGGFLVALNHPRWSLQSPDEYRDIEGFDAVEVYNTGCVDCGDCNAEPYDAILRTGKRLSPLATDDTHREKHLFGGFTMLKAPEFSYRALTAAYERGDLYASEGPEIYELYTEDGYVHIRTSPAVRIVMHTASRNPVAVTPDYSAGAVTEAVFRLPDGQRYLRIEVRDAAGNTAYTRAYDETEW